MTTGAFDLLTVAQRVYAVRGAHGEPQHPPKRPQPRRRRIPQRTVVFDTETTVDHTQRLNFGVYRYYMDRPEGCPGSFCVEEGIVFADDLADRDPAGYATLENYVATHRSQAVAPGRATHLRLRSRTEFVEQFLWRYGYKLQATIVGFNLPFDLSRLAVGVGASRGRFAGGFSLKLFDPERFRPRVTVRTLDSKRAFLAFTTPHGAPERFRGHFLDLRTLAFALTDRGHSLESACAAFGVPYTKRPVVHGAVTEDYVTYCREDVAATARLLSATVNEYRRHPVNLQVTKGFSPASIGKSYLAAMGILPILDRQPDFESNVLGWGMAASYGGRAECRIRKVPLPVVYVDFLSMYPTVNALMGSWRLVTARRVALDDATVSARKLLKDACLLERCFTKALWPKLLCLVEIEPDGDVLPVRAAYDPASADFGIGVNPYRSNGSAWYALADVIASVVLTGRVPTVKRAITLRPVGRQGGLRPVDLRGMVEIDPRDGDFFRQAIELRRQVEQSAGCGPVEDERQSRFLKILANATSYGILAEFTRHEATKPVPVTVYGDRAEPFETKTPTPEDPGPYCFPPLAAAITAGARLMLALLERSVTDAGGAYVFCDTDSMGIVADSDGSLHACPGGPERTADRRAAVRALTWEQADQIVGRFTALNPYDRTMAPGSILKIESENFDGEGRRRQLWCWALSAKRYVLYTPGADGPVLTAVTDGHEEASHDGGLALAKTSQHGLGHLLNPTDPDNPSGHWIEQAWEHLLRRALGVSSTEPTWLDRPALTRVTASTPTVLRWFAALNAGKPYAEQIKPANFLLLAHPDPLDPSQALPITPYQANASKREQLSWIDRRTGRPVAITTEVFDGHERPGVVGVRTYRQVLADYLGHPEAKSLGPDGQRMGRNTAGLLSRRPVKALLPFRYIGKEGNRLDDRIAGLVTDHEEFRTEHIDPDRTAWQLSVVPVLKMMDRRTLIKVSGLHRRTIERYLYAGVLPHPKNRSVLVDLSKRELREEVRNASHAGDSTCRSPNHDPLMSTSHGGR